MSVDLAFEGEVPEFVDSNVVLYAHDVSADDKYEIAQELLRRLTEQKIGAASIQVLQEFYVNARRKLRVPISAYRAQHQLRSLSTWSIHEPTTRDVQAAAELAETAQLTFWDAMIVTSAAALGCKVLWSEDLNHGQVIGGVEIRNPFR